jgi:dephospho-CoA kinase
MKLLGLTGGVGMGKSTAAEFLVKRGVSLVDTDILARQVVERGQPALKEIQRTFGDEVIASDGQLRRDVLARIVFSDPAARQKLESLTHPRIRELWGEQVAHWRAAQIPVACVVIPLLFETAAEREFDATICVACSPATQQKRLQLRGWTPIQISQRIAAQFPVERKIAGANFVVWSEGGLDVLEAQLDRVLASFFVKGT